MLSSNISKQYLFLTCLLCQGSFPKSGFSFKVYYPSNRTVEDRWGFSSLFVFGVFNNDNGGFNGDCAQTKQFSYFFFTANFKGCEENPGFAI